MRPRRAQMREDVGAVAACFLQGVGKDGEAVSLQRPGWQGAVVVGGLSEGNDGGRLPCVLDGDGAEGVAEDAVQQVALSSTLTTPQSSIEIQLPGRTLGLPSIRGGY